MANDSLSNAKNRKNDEFYTVFDYIQKEMNAYLEYNPDVFRGKTVLLMTRNGVISQSILLRTLKLWG